jgi:hypothetical protein
MGKEDHAMQDRDTGVKGHLIHKNCMGLIARVYGVALGEMFFLYSPNGNRYHRCKLCEDGLWSYEYNHFGLPYWHDISFAIYELITGQMAVQKMNTEDTVRDFMGGGDDARK